MSKLFFERWNDIRWMPWVGFVSQVDNEGRLHKRGALVANWMWFSAGYTFVEVD